MKVLIISHSFPPATVGAATVMYNLCKHIPKKYYTVITTSREFSSRMGVCDEKFALNCNTIRLPVQATTGCDDLKFLWLAIANGLLLDMKHKFDCLLAVFPNAYNLLAAYILHKLTKKPFIVYMHDLFTENLGSMNKLARFFWESFEAKLFSAAPKVLVMNEKFREHYLKRGVKNLAIVPPSISLDQNNHDSISLRAHVSKEKLRIVFTGTVYSANEDAVLAFLKETEKMNDVEVLFATQSKQDYLKKVSVGFLSKKECTELQRKADVLFLPLSSTYDCPEEVQCAIPSKTMDYLVAGKPILAVVPKESHMEDFIKKHEVGIAVTELSAEKIAHAIEELKDEEKRREFSWNSLKTAKLFDARIISRQLCSMLDDVISSANL